MFKKIWHWLSSKPSSMPQDNWTEPEWDDLTEEERAAVLATNPWDLEVINWEVLRCRGRSAKDGPLYADCGDLGDPTEEELEAERAGLEMIARAWEAHGIPLPRGLTIEELLPKARDEE